MLFAEEHNTICRQKSVFIRKIVLFLVIICYLRG